MKISQRIAEPIVDAIIQDLNSRNGVKLTCCTEGIQREIREDLINLVVDKLPAPMKASFEITLPELPYSLMAELERKSGQTFEHTQAGLYAALTVAVMGYTNEDHTELKEAIEDASEIIKREPIPIEPTIDDPIDWTDPDQGNDY